MSIPLIREHPSSSFDDSSETRQKLQEYMDLHPPVVAIADAALTALADAPIGESLDFLVQAWPGLSADFIQGFWQFISPKRARLEEPAARAAALREMVAEGRIGEFLASGGLEKLGRWLQLGDVGTSLAVFSFLEKIEMTVELLRDSKIGKILVEALKTSENPTVLAKGKILLNSWKLLVPRPVAPAPPAAPPKPAEPVVTLAPPKPARPETPPVEYDFSALASLAAEAPRILKKKKVQWETEIAAVIQFDIDGCPLEISGASSGSLGHSETEVRRFNDARQRERFGQGRKKAVDADGDDEIEISVNWEIPSKIAVPEECMFFPKNLKSYEKQDLADIHSGRSEMFFPDSIPNTPGEPSTSSGFQAALAATHHIKTIDVGLRGLTAESIDLEEPPMPEDSAKFSDEFVKLDGKLQTAIMGNEQLLKYFRSHPSMLKDLNADKVAKIVGDFMRKPNQTSQPAPTQPVDKSTWGVASIVSSIKSQVRTNINQRGPGLPNRPH